MRSARPKPLHLLCGRAMLLYVLDSLADCELDRVVVVVGHGAERVTKKLQEDGPDLLLEFVEQHDQRGTGDAASVGLTGLPDDARRGRRARPARRHAAAAGRDHRRLVEAAPRHDGAATVLTADRRRPHRLRPGRARRGRPGRPHRRARPTPPTRSRPSTRSTPRSTASAGQLLAPALRRLSPENAQGEYYLTDVVGVLHDAGYPVGAVTGRRPRRGRGRQRPGPARRRRGRAAPRAPTSLAARRGHHGRPRPHLRRHHRAARPRRHPVPRHDPPRRTHRGRPRRDRSRHPPGRLRGRRGRVVEQTMARDAEIGDGGHVGPFAVLEPGTDRPRRHAAPVRSTLPAAASEGLGSRPGSVRRMELITKKKLHLVSGAPTWPSPRRSPTASASSSARPTSPSSPTASCTAASASRSAAPTCSSSRATAATNGFSVNDAIMEQLIMVDAAQRASAKRITVVCPFYGYGRQDRKAEGREPITAKLVANLFAGRRGPSAGQRRPALGPDPGLLRRPGRPPDRHARAGRAGWPGSATTSSSCRPTPAG